MSDAIVYLEPWNCSDIEDALSVIVLGGVRSPGVVTLSGHAREQNIDVQEAKGQAGASTVRQGSKVGTFTASFYLATQDDFDTWPKFKEHCESTVIGAKPQAMDIIHPDLNELGYHSVILKKMDGKKHDGKDGATVSVEFSEYFPKKAVPSASSAGSKQKQQKEGGVMGWIDDQLDQGTNTLLGLLGQGNKTPDQK